MNNKIICGEFMAKVAVSAIAAGNGLASVAKFYSVDEEDEESVKAWKETLIENASDIFWDKLEAYPWKGEGQGNT